MICLQKVGRHFVWAMLLVCVFSVNGADKITKQPEKIEIEKVSLTQLGEMITTITGGTEKSLDAKNIEQIVSKFSQGETLKHLKMLAKGSDEAAKIAAILLRIADAYQNGARGEILKNIAIEEIKSYGWDKLKGQALETLAKKFGTFAIIKKANGAYTIMELSYDASKYGVYLVMLTFSEETMNDLEKSWLTKIADGNAVFWDKRSDEFKGLKKDIGSWLGACIDSIGGYSGTPEERYRKMLEEAQKKKKAHDKEDDKNDGKVSDYLPSPEQIEHNQERKTTPVSLDKIEIIR